MLYFHVHMITLFSKGEQVGKKQMGASKRETYISAIEFLLGNLCGEKGFLFSYACVGYHTYVVDMLITNSYLLCLIDF